MGIALVRESVRLAGPYRWQAHQEVMACYWRRIEEYLDRYPPSRLAVYQDGLPVDGEVGRHIIREAAGRGSRNHQVLLRLIDRGAQLRLTEDVELLLREKAQLAEDPDEASKAELLAERDRLIAGNIGSSLGTEEIGVLFIGAGHRIGERLAPDIVVEAVKDPRAVQAYFQALLVPGETDAFSALADYLKESISPPS
jgi:hypothetical protein